VASSLAFATSANVRRPVRSEPSRPKRLGSETPRIFTPPLRELTPETTLGFECIEFSENTLDLELMPWQRWFLLHALELHPTEVDERGEPVFRFRKVVFLVGRQNGKSTVMQALTLWRMFVDRCSLVIGTAQDLEIAESLLRESYELAEEVDELKAEMGPLMRGSGKMAFALRSGETYKVKAASRRGGRGLSGELILLDELREHQSWDAWGAVTKTTNAKSRAQIYGISNAGDASSIVLRYLRKMAHPELGDPDGLNTDAPPEDLLDEDLEVDDSALGIFEWSAPPGADVKDRDGWAMANPSLGYRVRESTLASDSRTDPEWVFRTECMCQWSDGTREGPFPPGAWDVGRDSGSRVAADSPVVLCLDVSWDRARAHIGLAGRRDDGLPHAEVVASRAGTDWVIPWLTSEDRQERVRTAGVVVQATTGSPAASMVDAMRDADINVVEWKGADLTAATGSFYDAVREDRVKHPPWPALDLAAATAVPKLLEGGAFVWDRRKSPHDAAPLIAVTGAVWFMDTAADYDVLDSVR
jgi:hypothetical protein